jgi:hypothetical protein
MNYGAMWLFLGRKVEAIVQDKARVRFNTVGFGRLKKNDDG